jgi:hypothetical protein
LDDEEQPNVLVASTPVWQGGEVLFALVQLALSAYDKPGSHSSGCKVFETEAVRQALSSQVGQQMLSRLLEQLPAGSGGPLIAALQQQPATVGLALLQLEADVEEKVVQRTWLLGNAQVCA